MQAQTQKIFSLQKANFSKQNNIQSHEELTMNLKVKLGNQAQKLLKDIQKYKQKTNDYLKYSFPTLKFQKEITKSNVCAKIFPVGTKAFKCHQCMLTSNSIICVQCFQKGNHKGHIFELVQVYGGCCDCGNQEAWDSKGQCCQHSNSSALQQIKINQQVKTEFIKLFKLGVYYLFYLFQSVNIQTNEMQKENAFRLMNGYGVSLFEYIYKFNINSLISNLMTVQLFTSSFEDFYPDLLWLKKIKSVKSQTQMNLIQILFQMQVSSKTGDIVTNLLTSLFTIKDFKRVVTIIFCQKYNQNPQFAMGPFNHLSCQLFSNHQMIKNLVNQKRIKPLFFQVNQKQSNQFQDIANSFVRYYMDIEYLLRLSNGSGQIYLKYHIMDGNISDFAGYRNHSYRFQDSIDYYGIQFIYVNKLFKIIQRIKHDDKILIKGIQDLFQFIVSNQNIKNFKPTVYLSQQRALSLFIFALFQNNRQFTFDQNIENLITILGLNTQNSLEILAQIFKQLNYNIEQSALVLGHPQSCNRFYTYSCCTFKKNMLPQSLDFYLYKILTYILKYFKSVKVSQIGDFSKTLLDVENIFLSQDFDQEDESIFDRRKSMVALYYFINLVIQLSETKIHDIIVGIKLYPQNYQTLATQFYLNLIKTYKKISIKDLKSIIDAFFQNKDLFEKFISSNQDILIQNGKVMIKQESSFMIQGLNTSYLRCFKHQFTNLEQTFFAQYKPSENHFSLQIFDKIYIQKAIEVLIAYRDIIIMKGGKIKQKQSGVVCSYIKQLIKLQFCLRKNQQISQVFINLFKGLTHDKKSLQLFDVQLIKQFTLAEQHSKKLHQNIKQEQKQREQDIKRRLLEKKKKKIAKFKKTREKIQATYKQEINSLQIEIDQATTQNYDGCIICRQNKVVNDDLMLMGYMQNSDLYYQYLKGKSKESKNYHIIFKSCGHRIHNSCYIKINGNRQYSTCQLCKSTTNVLFSNKIEQINQFKQQDKIIIEIMDNMTRISIINVIITQKCQNGYGIQFQDERDIQEQLIQGFVNQFIFSALLNEGFYIKKQLIIYKNILKSLKLLFKKNKPKFKITREKSEQTQLSTSQSYQMIDEKELLKKRIIQHLQIYIRSKLNSYFFQLQQQKAQIVFSQKIKAKIDYLFSMTLSQKTSSTQIQLFQNCKELQILRSSIIFYSFPQNLQILVQKIGKCQNCLNFTNMVMICVLCSWHGCKGCKKQSVIDHSSKMHSGNGVFIQGDNGCIFYVSRRKYWNYASIYEDYVGDEYNGYKPDLKLFKYLRNDKKIKQIYQDIVQHQIEQKIRYQQTTKIKINLVRI